MNTNPASPKTFDEKVAHLLGHIYENGGGEYKPMKLNSNLARSICASSHTDEVESLMYALLRNEWVEYEANKSLNGDWLTYDMVLLTPAGKREYERLYSKAPMAGLVNQEISTGNLQVDEKINHAKKLFFSEPPTMDNMRSACETLSYILEPIRDDLGIAITVGDVNTLFELINKFDIRHNKEHTKNINYPEQLEWVFYSLLNTINTYTKLKSRLLNLKKRQDGLVG